MMALSQILYATRKDLNSPQFSLEEDNVVRESNNNVSIIVVLGLVSAMLLGGIPLSSTYCRTSGAKICAGLLTFS